MTRKHKLKRNVRAANQGANARNVINDAVNFESLENRQLMAVVNVADFGATANDGSDDRAAIQRAIDASSAGDTVQFQSGRYEVGGELHMRTDRSYKGAGNLATTLHYNLPDNGWGMKILPDAKNVVVENFKFDGGGIALTEGSGYRNVTIRNNDITNVRKGTYWGNGPSIFQGVRSEGLTI